jgi:omega-6 fatty acid desaturase (delta-12 desaturase)
MKPIASWNRMLAPYAIPETYRSIGQLINTLILLAITASAAFAAASYAGVLFSLPISALTGVFLVRIFIIQHDCGHKSFLKNHRACDIIGRCLSVLTLTPYDSWRRDHDRHHASSGNLERRGHGDINTLTVAEYSSLGPWGKIGYRVYRHPLFLFGLGPAWQFLVRTRFPARNNGRFRRDELLSVTLTNLSIMGTFAVAGAFTGYARLAEVWLPAVLVGSTIGVWLFYVQHQFEETYWDRRPDWDYINAALIGCSFYSLPRLLHWATGWIGYHHIHHLSSRIPNYKLARAFRDIPELRKAKTIGLAESFECAGLSLWCEERRRLVRFAEVAA